MRTRSIKEITRFRPNPQPEHLTNRERRLRSLGRNLMEPQLEKPMSEGEWYYVRDGQRQGPITSQTLRELVTAGEIQPTDLVWTEGQSDWNPAHSIQGLLSDNQANDQGPPPIVMDASTTPTRSNDIIKRFFQSTLSDSVARMIQKVAWSICGGVIILGGFLFVLSENAAESAIQQAAAGAFFSTVFIAAYVLARAIEKFTNL